MCSPKEMKFISIMFFYAILSYVLMPFVAYKGFLPKSIGSKGSLQTAGNGFIIGSVLSLGLWMTIGSKMV